MKKLPVYLLIIFILIIISSLIKRSSEYIKLQNDPEYTNKKLHHRLIIGIIFIVLFMLIYFRTYL